MPRKKSTSKSKQHRYQPPTNPHTTSSPIPPHETPQHLQTFTLFPSLPLELRRKIWSHTLIPRTLTITLHPKPNNTKNYSTNSHHSPECSLSDSIITFTAREGIHPNNHENPPTRGEKFTTFEFRGLPFMSTAGRQKPPPGPTALRVCSESRMVALEHYQLAFGGVDIVLGRKHVYPEVDEEFNEAFNHGRIGEPKIWVDFKRDTLFFAGVEEPDGRMGSVANSTCTLATMTRYARREMALAERVAMTGCWVGEWVGNARDVRGSRNMTTALVGSLREFKGLRELRLYSTDRYRVNTHAHFFRLVDGPDMREYDDGNGGDGKVDILENRIVDFLMAVRGKDESWTHVLPSISVLRDIQWKIDKAGMRLEFITRDS